AAFEAGKRKKVFHSAKRAAAEAFHTCAVCGKTDLSDPRLEFRIGTDGEDYCVDHLPQGDGAR
ncbi:MAG: rhomboid family intramembrane serine protease, partial [Luteolibacter sp.]